MFNDSKIDPKILAKASEWTSHQAPDGRPYYYNAKSAESTWERPQALKELDDARIASARVVPMVNMQPLTMSEGNISFDQSGNLVNNAMNNKRQADFEAERERKRKEDAEKAKQAAKPLDKSRPISSTPILGTPWCVVWTGKLKNCWICSSIICEFVHLGDSRVFFYNPSTRTSVWEKPEDLIGEFRGSKHLNQILTFIHSGRADVDKAVNTIPEQLKGSELAEKNAEKVSGIAIDSGKKDNYSEKSMDEGDDEEDDKVPAKKSKLEGKMEENFAWSVLTPQLFVTESPGPLVADVKVAPPQAEKKIDLVKDGVAEAEAKAAKERQMVPLEIRVKQFKDMLQEKEVSAFSTWEKELHKIVFDPRYLLLASKERKQVFEKYVKDRAEDERREKRHKMQKKRDEFKAVMEEANLHSR